MVCLLHPHEFSQEKEEHSSSTGPCLTCQAARTLEDTPHCNGLLSHVQAACPGGGGGEGGEGLSRQYAPQLTDMDLLSKPGGDAQPFVCMHDSSCGHNMYRSHRIAGISPSGQVEV